MQRADDFARTRRPAFLLVPILLLLPGLAATVAAEEPPGAKAAQVDVRLTEYAIEMPRTLTAGPTAFLVRNDGRKVHSFKIEGPGLAELLSAPVQPHATATLAVTLQPGEYKVYCPVGSHADKGMTLKLTVHPKPTS